MILKKISINYSITPSVKKQRKLVETKKIEFIRKDVNDTITKRQSKLIFNGTQ